MEALVTTPWLAGEIGAPDLLLLDATYTSTLPGAAPRDPQAEFAAGHIPGARFLDLDGLVDAASALPSMLPGAAQTAARLRALGMREGMRVVLYDNGPHHTACRAWWVLRMAGFGASLLDGGMAKWQREGRPLEPGAPASAPGSVAPGDALGKVRSLAEMRGNVGGDGEQVVDARSAARFTGAEADPRREVAAGHIPGSKNLPYPVFFRPDGTWKAPQEIAAIFEDAGIDVSQPLVATCGSGITAAVIVFAAHLLGSEAALYDGSWTEWGADPTTPKALGPA
jgi:thiosulfate/3-mercaptopyruvate sulfurtransferase